MRSTILPANPDRRRIDPAGAALAFTMTSVLVAFMLFGGCGCAGLASLFGVAAPVAAQAAGAYAAAVASARTSGELPADPRVDAIEARIRKLEAEEIAARATRCSPDAGTAPEVLTVEALEAHLEADARERSAIVVELRALRATRLPRAPAVLPVVHFDGGPDASADGAP